LNSFKKSAGDLDENLTGSWFAIIYKLLINYIYKYFTLCPQEKIKWKACEQAVETSYIKYYINNKCTLYKEILR